ncbi:MAG: DSD1 family PLP-dependent enzyme [Vulcanimicrobiaceae bacterium]
MLQPQPALIGQREDEIDTPALLLDLDAFEYNLDAMAALFAGAGARLRPHAKAHKSPVIARLQIARGAVGQCVQKVGEAEAMVWGGVRDVLVSNEVVGAAKLARFAALARLATIAICADSEAHVLALESAAAAASVRLPIYVEIDAGGGRCGIEPGERAALLARRIAQSEHLTFGGLQAYHGSAQHRRRPEERAAAIDTAAGAAQRTIDALARFDLKCPVVTGGGTGTFEYELASGVFTEIQAGSYCFMDADYARNLDADGKPVSTFRQSLFVLSTVMSVPRAGVAVLDAGHKAVTIDSGLPLVWQRPELAYVDASDEHGTLSYAPDAPSPQLGEKVRLIPGHCDPTVDRHDWYVGVRNGRVESIWPISARGAMR